MDDYALIVPKPGKEKETIRLLLELAENRRHVQTNTDGPGLTLIVPEYLHKKYIQSGETTLTGRKPRGRPPAWKKAAQAAAEAETPESED